MEAKGPVHIETEEEKRFKVCCSTCRFCREHKLTSEGLACFECRKHPPRTEGFPIVNNDDWCSEHKFWENEFNG